MATSSTNPVPKSHGPSPTAIIHSQNNNCNDDEKDEGECIGYISLPNAEMIVDDDVLEVFKMNEWQKVEVMLHSSCCLSGCFDNDKKRGLQDGIYCPICTPRLIYKRRQENGDENAKSLVEDNDENDHLLKSSFQIECPLEFNGKMDEVFCRGQMYDGKEQGHKRSDLSLILSLVARAIEDCGLFEVLVRVDSNDPAHVRKQDDVEKRYQCIHVIILARASSTLLQKEQVVKESSLLLELLSHDWNHYDQLIHNYKLFSRNEGLQSIFPDAMNFQEIFSRIGKQNISLAGDTEFYEDFSRRRRQKMNKSTNLSSLEQIPHHLFIPFLTSVSVGRLRCASKTLYFSLSSVVPGMRLTLVEHQTRSLIWMRSREAPLRYTNCVGAPVKIVRGRKTGNRYIFDGNRVKLYQNTSNLSRVGCGGLLCDDPGLGKTITALSVVLQTVHHTHRSHEDNSLSDIENSVFKAYFSILPSFDRRKEMRTILNQLSKLDHCGK